MISHLIELLSCFLLSSFLGLFMIPNILFHLFYFIPNCIRFIRSRQMGMHTLKEIILELMGWSISITAVLMLLYYIDPDILYEVLWGPGAVIAWLIGFFHLNYTVLVKYRILQDRFYFKYFQPDYLAK